MIVTFWERKLFNLNEDEMIFITDVRVKEYFGAKLASTGNTMVMKSRATLVENFSKDRANPLQIRVLGGSSLSEIEVECLNVCMCAVSFEHVARGNGASANGEHWAMFG